MTGIAETSSNEVRERVVAIVADFLHIEAAEIDPRKPLSLYALDSLASVELTTALEDAFEQPLPEWLLNDHPDIESLTLALCGQKAGDDRELMARDSVLPADVRPSMVHTPSEHASRVLLTGATGFLGAHLVH